MSPSPRADVSSALAATVGLRLLGIGRAADLATLTFGTEGRKAEDVILHVQCPWRLERDGAIVTGRTDLFEPLNPDDPPWPPGYGAYDSHPNLQDAKLKDFHRILETSPDVGRVIATRADAAGGFEMDLTGGLRVAVFPAGSRGEHWRLLRRDGSPHVVVPAEE